jgi:HlyD family secretion protein
MQQHTADSEATSVSVSSFRSRLLRWLAAGLVALLLASALWWWFARTPPLHYITARVTRGDIERSVSMTGALNPVVTAQLGSYVSGNIKSWSCDYNTLVKVGQSCAIIDPLPFQVVVDQDEADVRTAEAQLLKDRAARKNAAVIYDRDVKLIDEGIVSQETLDTDKATLDQAVAQVALDIATIADKKAVLHAAKVNLGYTNIVSPVEGMVITRYIDVGQTVVSSLQSSTLFLIGKDMHKMQVDSNVSEADVGEIKAAQKANFTVQSYPNRTFIGRVRQIREGPITVQNVVTYDVVIDVDNADLALFPGMTADAHIITAESRNVLRVPLPATRFNPEGFTRAGRDAEGAHARAAAAAAGAGDGPRDAAQGEGRAPSGATPTAPSDAGETGHGSGAWARRNAQGGTRGTAVGQPEGPHSAHGHAWPDAAPRAHLWVMREGKLVEIRVRTGLDDGTLIEVTSDDLHEGDLVVVNAVRPNAPRPENADGANRGAGANAAARAGAGNGVRL